MSTKKKFTIHLEKATKNIVGTILSEEYGVLKIKEENGVIHRFNSYKNITESTI